MIRINQIKIPINISDDNWYKDTARISSDLRNRVSKSLRIEKSSIRSLDIVKHSIDARKKPELFDVYTVDVTVKGESEDKLVKKARDKNVSVVHSEKYDFLRMVKEGLGSFAEEDISRRIADSGRKILIIGAGPAGLFCGYELAKAGFKPVILERGADVDKRLEIVEKFWATGELDVRTNVQFGEGGAGTFSDGKLNTMVKDKFGRGLEALDIFVRYGAPEKIKYDAKPHIGTDILKDAEG